MRILGISAYYHDSAAALIEDGRIVRAAQEERFTRKKHDASFPSHAIEFCTDGDYASIDSVAFYDKPFLKFERLLETYLAFAPRGLRSFRTSMPVWIGEKLFQKRNLLRSLRRLDDGKDWEARLLFAEHHQSHAASAFYASPFERAAVLTLDGAGEWTTTSLASGDGNRLKFLRDIPFPHSLGLLYSAFTYYTGFKVNSGEYKLMGLAPYGEPRFAQHIREHLIDVKPDGSFRLNMRYFDYCTGLRMTNRHFERLFGEPVRRADEPLTQFHMDVAASVQQVLNDVLLRLTRSIARETKMRNLCLAGGVALNCVANGHILRDGQFENVWVQPAAGDAGGALGAALAAYYQHHGAPRAVSPNTMRGSYLGPSFEQQETERRLRMAGARFSVCRTDDELLEKCSTSIAEGQAVGWFQGRMEFGPRALGARSILGDARSPAMQSTLNLKVKYRESFRPFAPSVLKERASEWFALDAESPYMLLVADVHPAKRREMTEAQKSLFGIEKLNVQRSAIPAVTHVDYSARVQTVDRETNPLYHALLSKFEQKTGCPVIVNTSFNVRGEPIVNTPEDAFRCFMGTEIEALAIGRCWLRKADQDPALRQNYETAFVPD
ncbi:MAG: carbamoyltransferase [Acidobacteria bacterium]|nr:carbamoyltransferase [Acidobacteriota bacterium]